MLGLAILVGVGIDVDHFIVSRVQRGDWQALKRCLRRPSIVIVDQDAVFASGDLTALQRLLSHHLIGGLLVVLGWSFEPIIGWLLLAVIYVHVLADLVHDVREEWMY